MSALYQKYRPNDFSAVIGQQHIVKTLIHALTRGSLSHGYLFAGSRGVGKTTLARILARSAICLQPKDGVACGSCTACLDPNPLDIIEIDAASYTGVDNIREVIEQARLLPSVGRRRVYIIDEVHMLSKAAFNALLKTLEEPPSHTVFILATTEYGKIPATVLSRVQRFDFSLHGIGDIVENLRQVVLREGVEMKDDVLELIAKASYGGMRDALTLLDQALALNATNLEDLSILLGLPDQTKVVEVLSLVVGGRVELVVEFFQNIGIKMVDMKSFLTGILKTLREILELRMQNAPVSVSGWEKVSMSDIMHCIRLCLRAYKEQMSTPDMLLPVMLAALEMSERFSSSNDKKRTSLIMPEKHEKVSALNPAESFARKDIVEVLPRNTSERFEKLGKDGVSVGESIIDIEALRLCWGKICEDLVSVNAPLANTLKLARVRSVNGGSLHLSVRYDFHRKQIEQPKYMNVIAQVLLSNGFTVSGVTALVDRELLQEGVLDVGGVAGAMQIFGVEAVE